MVECRRHYPIGGTKEILMRLLFILSLIFLVACEGQKSESKDSSSGGKTLWHLYNDPYYGYEPYTTSCPNEDHGCVSEDAVHQLTNFSICEALSQWEYGSGEKWIISTNNIFAGLGGGDDYLVFQDNNPDFNVPEGSFAGYNGPGYPGSWFPYGIVNGEYLPIGNECHIKIEYVLVGSNNVPTITEAKYDGILFYDDGLLYNQ
ncbi:MAG: hypothetical protein R3213_09560 [Flavobacteriaceae bacterium]|nr:hypothetical protein [Flavobacteriaceae bacterium]